MEIPCKIRKIINNLTSNVLEGSPGISNLPDFNGSHACSHVSTSDKIDKLIEEKIISDDEYLSTSSTSSQEDFAGKSANNLDSRDELNERVLSDSVIVQNEEDLDLQDSSFDSFIQQVKKIHNDEINSFVVLLGNEKKISSNLRSFYEGEMAKMDDEVQELKNELKRYEAKFFQYEFIQNLLKMENDELREKLKTIHQISDLTNCQTIRDIHEAKNN
ncbi:hypothetical protein DMENIID0001_034750 [Sergentomyia squamirostris]